MEQNILKNAELKTTKKRQMLLFLLQKHARPMTAEELRIGGIIDGVEWVK